MLARVLTPCFARHDNAEGTQGQDGETNKTVRFPPTASESLRQMKIPYTKNMNEAKIVGTMENISRVCVVPFF